MSLCCICKVSFHDWLTEDFQANGFPLLILEQLEWQSKHPITQLNHL